MHASTRRELLGRAVALGLAAPAAATLAACGASETAGSAPRATVAAFGGTIRVGVPAPATALDPVSAIDPGGIALAQQAGEYLALARDDGSLTPLLAERWQANAAYDAWSFQLRPDVRFSDGRPLTAADVVATFERLVDTAWKSPALTIFAGILATGGVTGIDAQTVRFELERPFVDFPTLVSSANYSAVVLPADYDGKFERSPIGTGPFRLVVYERGVRARLERNPRYWRLGVPTLDAVEFVFADLDAQALALEAGELDVLAVTPHVVSVALASEAEIEIRRSPSSAWLALHMRVDAEPWNDQRVRQALALAVDREVLLNGVQGGFGSLGNDHVFPPALRPSPLLPQRHRDIAEARRLLAEAGHERGLDVTLTTLNQGAPPDYAALVKNAAADAGIRIEIDLLPLESYYGSGDSQPWLEVPLGLVPWAARPTPSQIVQQTSVCGAAWNAARWCNPEFDQLARKLDAAVAADERLALATRMAEIQHTEVPLIVAYWSDALRAVRRTVSGVEASGSGYLDLTRAALDG